MEKDIENASKESPEEEEIKEGKEETIEEKIEISEESENDLLEEPMEKSVKKSIGDTIKKHKNAFTRGIISLCVLLVIYFGMSIYFIDHFYFGTEINGVNVSGKTLEDTEEIMTSELADYTLTLKERKDKTEEIKANEVALEYSSPEKIQELKESQKSLKWPLALFNNENSKITIDFSYDSKRLKEKIDRLSCFDSEKIIEPKNPSFEYKGNHYIIIDEVLGTKVDKDILSTQVADAIKNRKTEMDLNAEGCYIDPQYYSKSKETIEIRDTLNKYVSTVINYDFDHGEETLDASTIHNWLSVNEEFEIIIDEEGVRTYVNELSQNYNTIGKTRDFITSSGQTIKVGGGDYGYAIAKDKEIEKIMSELKEGKTVEREPEYSQKAFARGNNDIGDTYVEISLSGQYMWFYKNGSLITQGNIVTGNIQKNHTTPPGVYRLKYKSRNVVLRGPGYASPVTFWMPFNGGIGIHDASWRNTFGGNIYKTNGSHGCINSPYQVAKAIFENIEPETPVVCY